jgi:streptogramin lyase
LISLLPLTGAAPPAHGNQEGVFTFRSYGLEDGLANLGVYAIAQDAQGFLWAGTDDGLYRYDGHRFLSWRKGLKSSLVWDIATGPAGEVWANTDDGIFRLEGPGMVPVEGLPGLQAAFFALGPGGRAFAGQGNYIYHRSGAGPMERLATLPSPATAGWASKDLKTLLVTTVTRIHRLEGGAWSDLPLPKVFHGSSARLLRDRSGRIFLRSRSELWRMDQWGGAWVNLSALLPGNAFNATAPVEDALGRIWLGSSKGLVCLDGDGSWVLNEAKGLPLGWAGPLLVDREGSLWVGSEGLHRIKGRFLWTNFGPHQGLPSPNVWDIGRSRDGRIFACTDHGVAVLHGETWTTLPGTRDRTLLAGGGDAKESLWFGGAGRNEATNSVFRLDLKSGRIEQVPLPPVKTAELVLAITGDGADGIYLGTLGSGVYRVHRNGRSWTTDALPFPDQGSQERINALRKDAAGHLWAASAHGLYILDQGRWTRLGRRDGLLGDNCGGLARDPQGFVWVSFLDAKGVNRVGPVNYGTWGVLQTMTQPEALFKDTISSMTFDTGAAFWLGTSGGMKRWDGRNLEVFGRGEGLISQDPSANGIARDVDGSVWQGFSSGIAHYQPRAFTGVPEPPRARILEIQDGRGPVAAGGAAPRIPYKHHTLSFQFGTLSFLNEARIVHEVRLVGLENEWRESLSSEARYPALPAGTYTFEVRSRFNDGQPGPVSSFRFEILAPWWARWWSQSLAVLAAAGAILLGFRRRTAQLSRRNAHLETLVANRTEALNASKLDLERANRALEEAPGSRPALGRPAGPARLPPAPGRREGPPRGP